ncbi:MAG: TRAP transporter substrate-binding protein [Spirochaetaceae bacterium]|jgi:tripartite ATP-independent transporter DctP family solute receptor|nr:TRAP transporter substrate-binding protein [Spirochaetaceae bacterium]
MKCTYALFMAALVMVFAGCDKKTSAQLELKFAHYGAEDSEAQTAAKQFAANVERRTDGAVKIIIYANNTLGSPPEILEQLFLGTVDMTLSGHDQFAKHIPLFDTVSIPFSLISYEHADKVLDGPFKDWAKPELEKMNVIMLSNWEWGFRQITNSKRPVLKPEDIAGLKIRTPPAMAQQAAMQALGANVQTISFGELSMAMRQGVVDGQENPISTIYNLKLYESQKYITMINYLYSSLVHSISKDAWNKLTDEQKTIFQEESDAARLLMRQIIRDNEAYQITEMRNYGIQVDSPDLKPFAGKMQPAYEKIRANTGADNFDKWMNMAALYAPPEAVEISLVGAP